MFIERLQCMVPWFWKSNLRRPAERDTFKVRAGPIWANLEPVGFIISTFLSNLGVVGFININFLDPQNDRFLAFSPCKTAKRVQKKFRARFARRKIFGVVGFIIPNSQTNLDPVVFIRGGGLLT